MRDGDLHRGARPRAAAGVADPPAVTWAADALTDDDTTVAALARRLGVDWHTLWDALKVEAHRRADDPNRLTGVESLGVDEHIWRPGKFGQGREVTCMVDLTRDATGQVRARLLDLVLGRSGPAYAGWLDARQPEFRAQIKSAALDPFRGYANALRDSLSDAVQVLDAFHVVKLGTQVVDEVRRRVQQEHLGRRGHKNDPLQDPGAAAARPRAPHREAAHPTASRSHRRRPERRGRAGLVLLPAAARHLRRHRQPARPASPRREGHRQLPTCPIPEVARLGRTLRAWRSQVLAYFDTDGLSNGGTEAINMLIEKARRLAHGYRNFENYRLRMLLAASGTRTRRVRTEGP